jgi:hypothetical protein
LLFQHQSAQRPTNGKESETKILILKRKPKDPPSKTRIKTPNGNSEMAKITTSFSKTNTAKNDHY